MFNLTQAFTHQRSDAAPFTPTHQHRQMYDRLRRSAPTQDLDWVQESIRLAALIYTHAIIHHTTFTSAATALHPDPVAGNTTLIHALLTAVEHTDVAGCWGDLRGVFLWVCLIGGAASWGTETREAKFVQPPMAWPRKCFSLWAVRAVVGVGFEFADDVMDGLQMALRVSNLLDGTGS